MAECADLESLYIRKDIEGSNPSLSAILRQVFGWQAKKYGYVQLVLTTYQTIMGTSQLVIWSGVVGTIYTYSRIFFLRFLLRIY